MRLNISVFIIILLGILTISCDENVNLRSEFVEEPFLYCIVNIDSNYQEAIIKKSYPDKNNSNNNGKNISNASIVLESSNQFTSLANHNGEGDLSYYSTNEFEYLRGGDLSIRAILSDQSELMATIEPPSFSLFYIEQDEMSIPFLADKDKRFHLSWVIKNHNKNIAFIGLLFINYSKIENGDTIINRIEIPQEYVESGDKSIPIAYSITENTFQTFLQEVMDESLVKISSNDTNKSRYSILGGELDLYVMEENLATYFSSSETFKNSYSLKLYENEVSNIIGGKGLFGAYIKKSINVTIDSVYVESFGYKYK